MTLVIDGASIENKNDFYQNIKKELNAPEYFGNNLDALYDILTEQSGIIQIEFLHYNKMRNQIGTAFCEKLLKVLQNADILTIIDQH